MAVGRTLGIAVGLALALVSGCTGGERLPVPPLPAITATPSPVPSGVDMLRDMAEGGRTTYQIPVRAIERIADGTTVVANFGSRPLTILSIEPVFESPPPAGVLLGIQLIHLTEHDQVIGIARSYPPPGAALIDATGAIINPFFLSGDRFQIVVGLNVKSGTVAIASLRVVFRVDGATHTATFTHLVRLCAGRPPSVTTC